MATDIPKTLISPFVNAMDDRAIDDFPEGEARKIKFTYNWPATKEKGPKGDRGSRGPQGEQGPPGEEGLTPMLDYDPDGNRFSFRYERGGAEEGDVTDEITIPEGPQGEPGTPGASEEFVERTMDAYLALAKQQMAWQDKKLYIGLWNTLKRRPEVAEEILGYFDRLREAHSEEERMEYTRQIEETMHGYMDFMEELVERHGRGEDLDYERLCDEILERS